MPSLRGVLSLLAVCVFIILISVAGLASDFLTHLLSNIDGLLLFAICVMMGGIFALMLFLMVKEEGWLPGAHKKDVATAGDPGSRKPGEGK